MTLKPKWAGKFITFQQWVNKASSWIDGDAVCIDATGRRCLQGSDFMRARDENAFPVWFFWDCEVVDDEKGNGTRTSGAEEKATDPETA